MKILVINYYFWELTVVKNVFLKLIKFVYNNKENRLNQLTLLKKHELLDKLF